MPYSFRPQRLSGFWGLFLAGLLLALPARAQVPINEARGQGPGATVTVEGTVTRAFGDFVRFQDDSGPTGASGLVVRQTSGAFNDDIADGTISQGTELQVTGTLSEFNGLLQINEGDLSDYSVGEEGPVPAPQAVSLADITGSGEDYESELVTVQGLSFQRPDWQGPQWTFQNDRSYPVSDGSATLTFRMQGSSETQLADTPVPKGSFTYTGVVGEFNSAYQLIPTELGDLPLRFAATPRFAQVEEGGEAVEVSIRPVALEGAGTVSVTAEIGGESTADDADISGFDGPQTLTFSESNSSPKTLSFDPVADGVDEGVERLEIALSSGDGAVGEPGRFTLWLLDAPTAQRVIAEGDSGDALVGALQEQYGDPHPLGYDLARDTMYAHIYNEADTVEGTYSGYQITVDPSQGDASAIAAEKGINTEHTWPQSQGAGEDPARGNMHILVPARQEVNSARSNYPYGEIVDSEATQCFYQDQSQSNIPSADSLWSEVLSGDSFEPRHSVKGDVARAAFYFVTVYPNRANFAFFDEQRETLLEWHAQDPVDATEMRRNLSQASYQGNAVNPFVMDPTLADRAYGSGAGTGDDPGTPSATYELLADGADLAPASGQTDAQCLVQLSSGTLLFFNSEDGGIFTWDGSSLSVHRSAQDLNGDISSESNDIDRCDGVAIVNDVVYFLFRSSATNNNYVYRTEASTPSNNSFKQFNGANGVAADGSSVYLSAIGAFGAPADGIFELNADLSGSVTEFAANGNVSPGTIDVLGETLYGYSNDFGGGQFGRTLFSLDLTTDSPLFQVFANPFGIESPLTGGDPSNDDVEGIQDLTAITFGGSEFIVVYNENPTAPDGQEFGTVRVSDQSIDRLFTASDLTENLSVSGYSPAFAQPLYANDQGDVFAVSGAFGPDYIAKVSEASPLPVEFSSFDATRRGEAVTLTWQTASETNNARFEVQRQAAGGSWAQVGAVEGRGTTETVQAYRFTDPAPPFAAETLTYRLRQVDLDGSASYSDPVTVRQPATTTLLRAPFPNPTRGAATVQFAVPERQRVTLRLYDALGRRVQTLVDGARNGRQQVRLHTTDLSSGVYFLRLQAGGSVQTQRVTVVK